MVTSLALKGRSPLSREGRREVGRLACEGRKKNQQEPGTIHVGAGFGCC